jgi:trehalose 6-phosphate synthase/phosphatase
MNLNEMKKRLILISNRLPFNIKEKNGKIDFVPSAGGLVSSIKSYVQKSKELSIDSSDERPLWIGTSDVDEERYKMINGTGNLYHDDFELSPVFIPPGMYDKYYNGFCNDTIWPLFHYFPSYAKFTDEYFTNYVNANIIFCEKVLQVYRPGDIIWVHDYHLLLLPDMLRKHLPEAAIGFFLHIPFPSFELFRHIPSTWRKELLAGMLGADLVGFHTNDYVQHFLKSIREILGFDNTLRVVRTPDRSVTVDTFPISIDFAKFNRSSEDPEVVSERDAIRKGLNNVKIIISADRLDYAKGLVNRLEGFESFLEKYAVHRGNVTYVLLVVPSRDIITKYAETKREIEGLVSRINGKYGTLGWTPVIYQYKSLEFKKLAGLYLAANVALITPMRDGMNLVAKEFVASRADKQGVLILGETTGASSELGEAILVNPTDYREIADAIARSLDMPVEEQVKRNETMQRRLREYDVMKWAEDFLTQLDQKKLKQERLKIKIINEKIEDQILTRYEKAGRRLILLDYDGTLAPIASLPHLAVPGAQLLLMIKTLSEDEKNEVVLISGRPVNVLENWFGHLNVSLVAEHGAFYKKRDAHWLQTVRVNADWKAEVMQVLQLFTQRCPGSFVEEKALSLAWHYRNSGKDLGFLRSRELINSLVEISSHLNFQVIEGNKVIETRARGVDKGSAALLWLKQKKYDFVLGIGDDKTDEDLFRVIPASEFSIRVGLTQSVARFNLKHQSDVISLLDKFINSQVDSTVD